MLSGYRSVILGALACLISISFGLGWYHAALNYPQEQRYQPYRYAADNPAAPSALSDLKAVEYREPCRDPKGQDEADLCAQWKAANAAEDSAFWAKWSFWVASAGLCGLLVSLFYTRAAVKVAADATKDADRALEIAERNANAAAEQVKVVQENAHRQLRAYLGIKSVTLSESEWKDDAFVLTVQIINNGQTPGRVKIIRLSGFWLADGKKENYVIKYAANTTFTCHRDMPVDVPWEFVGNFQYCELNGTFVAMISIVYIDAFKKQWEERVVWQTATALHGPFYDLNFPVAFVSNSVEALGHTIDRAIKAGSQQE